MPNLNRRQGLPLGIYRAVRTAIRDWTRRTDFKTAKDRLLASPEISHAERSLLEAISLDTVAADLMYERGRASEYLTAGMSASSCIRSVFERLPGAKPPRFILDLPSGFGRVLRFLKVMFPGAELTAAETQGEALSFCNRAFGARVFQSCPHFDLLTLPRAFDLIWCGSLVTHLGETDTSRLLAFFHRHLADGGVCIFTTHGAVPAKYLASHTKSFALDEQGQEQVLRGYEKSGYGYANYPNNTGYGVSLVTSERMACLAGAVGSWKQIAWLDHAWHGLQDVYGYAQN